MDNDIKDMTYEKAIKRLEEISQLLEKETADLDTSLSLFKEGAELAAYCKKKLDDAQLTIEKTDAAGGISK